ncbi:thioester domain-containing protein [Streptomyces somaliensis DSM 40738]|uniref:Cys-Gln thioester bond-forming surface protein n=1 Tax=Streptomyces somaliensis (strain ATCC 33201 / DSM 40738 / JCM 12659 / KCTC 9044 / NCTC 11332 / NRRL B-12077 / IP 733) TaxID=1134445 RepID=A0AA44IEE5_STRE0|nr:Cys-Gln thioester bond-forming surface protein [Streptomyces somaliensis]MCQ0022766.1 thioester domain-containing protein [Streptomyces somaliensis DSM 40738]NKY15685.1 Cys-Gln thioester bond-forming surface protein [Streptomyces somaliensis DSM 40738]
MFAALSVQRRERLGRRFAAAVLTSGLIAGGSIAGASVAVADEAPQHQGGASATLTGLKVYADAVLKTGGKEETISAGLFEMAVDGGGTLKTYCIDAHNPTQKEAKYLEASWDQTSLGHNEDAGKILWVLKNSYPQVDDLAGLAAKAEAGSLTKETAAAGTQVAIWRFSDGVDVTAKDPAAEKLADWLEKNARNLQEPKASLSLESNAVSGKAGGKLGPITVRTNAERATVTAPDVPGVKVTDKDGKPVTEAKDGTDLYVDVPAGTADGTATFNVQASTSVSVGRAFASLSKSQTQILAGSSQSTVSATASATWAKKGAIPALTAEKNCVKGGIDVTAKNEGDEAFTFELANQKVEIGAGESKTVTVPVGEDQAYDFTIALPGGETKTFKGVLDCKTSGDTAPPTTGGDEPGSEPSPQTGDTTSGGTTGGDTAGDDATGDLAETGASNATPMIAGIAVALLLLGGGAVFFLRKKKGAAAGQ